MKLYRVMKTAPDGKPLTGSKSMMLGVRPRDPLQPNKRSDVSASAGADAVGPGGGGLSCYSDPDAIKVQSAKLELWSIDAELLPPELIAQAAGEPHYHIEPRHSMPLDEFQRLLASTRDRWERVEGA